MANKKGLSFKSKRNKLGKKTEILSGVITPVAKKSSSLYKDLLKESAERSALPSPCSSWTTISEKKDGFDFHCSFESDEENMSVMSFPVSQPDKEKTVLQGVIAYIEVRTNNENRFDGISKQMQLLGAVVVKEFIPEVTHVVFKDGKKSTFDKATKKGIHLVNVLWVDACKQSGTHVSEALFPVSVEDEMHTPIIPGKLKRTKFMQPRSFEEDLRSSSEKINRRRRRLEANGKMSPLTAKSLSCQESPFYTVSSVSTFPAETPRSHKNLSEELELSGSIVGEPKVKRVKTTSGVTTTPTSPLAAPMHNPQTDSGLRKKRKRQECSKAVGRTKKVKKTRIQDEIHEEMSLKTEQFAKCKNELTELSPTKTVSIKDKQLSLKDIDNVNSGRDSQSVKRDVNVNEDSRRESCSNDVFFFTNGGVTSNMSVQRTKNKTTSFKRTKLEGKANSVLNGSDIFNFNEEVSEIKTTRLKKTSRSKSYKDVEDKHLNLQQKLTNPINENSKLESCRRASNFLSDSGISMSDAETVGNVSEIASFNKKLSEKSILSKVTTVENIDESSLSNVGTKARITNFESLSLPNSDIERLEHPPCDSQEKRPRKRRSSKQRKDCDASSNVNESNEQADLSEKSSKKSQNTGIKSYELKGHESEGHSVHNEKKNYATKVYGRKTKDEEKLSQKKEGDDSEDDREEDEMSSTEEAAYNIAVENDSYEGRVDSDDQNNTTKDKASRRRSKKKLVKPKKPSRSLVLTSMHFCDQDIVLSVVRKLGSFYMTDKVSQDTTHVVSGSPKRTLNVLTAIAQGCWLVSTEWVMKSLEAGYWIDEEPYELSESFPSAQLSRLERANTGPDYHQDLFKDVQPIFVCENTSPPPEALIKLITLCGGQVCTSIRKAGVCVGDNSRKVSTIKVSETWVIDSITEHVALPFTSYIL